MFVRNRDTEMFGRWSDSRNVDRAIGLAFIAFGCVLAIWFAVSV